MPLHEKYSHWRARHYILGHVIYPGDLVVAGSGGIVYFEVGLLDKVTEAVPQILAVENKVCDTVLKGGLTLVDAHKLYKPHHAIIMKEQFG